MLKAARGLAQKESVWMPIIGLKDAHRAHKHPWLWLAWNLGVGGVYATLGIVGGVIWTVSSPLFRARQQLFRLFSSQFPYRGFTFLPSLATIW